MTISDINTYVSFRANTDTTQYSAANRLISTNRWYEKIITMILDSQDEWDFDDLNKTDFPIGTANTVASQQDYALPAGIFKIKRVEVSYDGTNWKHATPIDVNEIGHQTNTTEIANRFTTATPFYDTVGNSIFLYPIPSSNVTNGLKVWFQREPAEFTSGEVTTGTKEPGFDEPFHVMIALGMIYDWCSAKGGSSAVLTALKNDVQTELLDYEARLRRHYGKKQDDRVYQLQSVYNSNYGK